MIAKRKETTGASRSGVLALLAGCLFSLQVVPAWSMTLREAAELAVKTYPDVRAAEEFGKALDQKVQQAFAGYLPKMDFTAGYGREKSDNSTTRSVHKTAGRTDHSLTMDRGEAGVVVKQMLFDGFDVRSKVAQARAQLQAAQARLELTADSVALTAVQAYVDLIMKYIQLEMIKDNVLLHQRILDKVQKKFEGGAGPQADVSQAKSRTFLASANHASNQAAYQNARAKFTEMMGMPALEEEEMVRPLTPENLLPKSVDEALQAAMNDNTELQAARFNVAAAEAGLEIAKAALWPTMDMELTATNNANVGGTEGHGQSMAAMLRMNYNAFDGGADVSRIQEQRNLLEQARQNLDKAQRSLEENTRETWHKLVMSQNRIAFMKQHYAVSKQVTASYHDQFKMGKRTLLDVLNSENELFSAKNGLLFEELTYVKNAYELFARMGTLRNALSKEPPPTPDQKIRIEKTEEPPDIEQPGSGPVGAPPAGAKSAKPAAAVPAARQKGPVADIPEEGAQTLVAPPATASDALVPLNAHSLPPVPVSVEEALLPAATSSPVEPVPTGELPPG
ncbi:MAG: TolC family outer membrane protein [Magnetococcales bacterium]|nr:TolC family outer membrane protein [Magnetococcales bacterium]